MSSYNTPGWKIKPSEMSDYTLVTHTNRKRAVLMGRIMYVIEANGNLVQYRGYFVIRPRLTKGRIIITDHPYMKDQNIWIPEEEDEKNYIDSFKNLIDLLISKKQLYFKLTDKLISYEKIKI